MLSRLRVAMSYAPPQATQDVLHDVEHSAEEDAPAVAQDTRTRSWSRTQILYCILVPGALSLSLWLVCSYALKEQIPHTMDLQEWRNFSTFVRKGMHAPHLKPEQTVLISLFAVHALQLLFCFPLIHVTKIMYGFIFGAWRGGLMSCCWELSLIVLFVGVATQNAPVRIPPESLRGFLDYARHLRERRLLSVFLVALHCASVPLVTATCLVLFRVVSRREFFVSHALATALTTFKDTWLGQFLAHTPSNAQNIAVGAIFLSLSTLMPTLMTLVLMGFVSHFGTRKHDGVCLLPAGQRDAHFQNVAESAEGALRNARTGTGV